MEIICRIQDTKLVIEKKIQRIGRIVRSKIGSKNVDNPKNISHIKIDIEDSSIDTDDDTNDVTERLLDENSNNCIIRKQFSKIMYDPGACYATANSDYVPSPYDKDALAFKSGEVDFFYPACFNCLF